MPNAQTCSGKHAVDLTLQNIAKHHIGKVVPFSSCTNCQHMPALVSVHLIGARGRHLSKLQ